jgi:hypothetical protein
MRLLRAQHPERGAGFQAQRLDASDHARDVFEIAVLRAAPGGAHAETRGALLAGLTRRRQHLGFVHQRLVVAVVVRMPSALRTVRAIFGATAGLDRQQRRQLHPIRIEVFAVNLVGLRQQVVEGSGKQILDGFHRPARVGRHGALGDSKGPLSVGNASSAVNQRTAAW